MTPQGRLVFLSNDAHGLNPNYPGKARGSTLLYLRTLVKHSRRNPTAPLPIWNECRVLEIRCGKRSVWYCHRPRRLWSNTCRLDAIQASALVVLCKDPRMPEVNTASSIEVQKTREAHKGLGFRVAGLGLTGLGFRA